MLMLEGVTVPPFVAADISSHRAVARVAPVMIAVNENAPVKSTDPEIICGNEVPTAVPVNAAPLIGAVPVPCLICRVYVPEVLLRTTPSIVTKSTVLRTGVKVPARPIITPVALVVPVGLDGDA